MKRRSVLSCCLGLCVGLVAVAIAPAAQAQEYVSPVAVAVAPDGATAYVAEWGARRLDVVDTATRAVTGQVALSLQPAAMAISADGAKLYVAGDETPGKVAVIDRATGKETAILTVGHTPSALALSPDGNWLYACNRFDNCLSVLDTAAGTEAARVPVLREPIAAALTPDGRWLVVGNHLTATPADGNYTGAAISIIDTVSRQVAKDLPLPNGSSGLRGVCISPDGRYAYATHVLGRYQMPTTQLERGWMNTNALSIIDVPAQAVVNTVLLDDVDLGAANPWGVTCTADGKYICVSHAGTHELSIIDAAKLHEKLAKAAAGEAVTEVSQSAQDVPNDLAFLVDVRRRLPLPGNGPRGIAAAGNVVYAAEHFTGSLAIVDVADPKAKAQQVALQPGAEMTAERKGEMFFNDAALCFQHWQSCASCHPDARADGLNWDLLNDGMGNPKNTKSMLLSHMTPPVMSLGVRETAEKAVRSGIRFIQFAVRPEEDALAIDAYLKALKPVTSPHLGEAATRGKALFEQAGCAVCHPGPMGTDLKGYDVGTAITEEKLFDTPALVEVWRTAPYLHDGRATTIMEVLTKFNKDDKHGVTSSLNPDQLKDLAAYVLAY